MNASEIVQTAYGGIGLLIAFSGVYIGISKYLKIMKSIESNAKERQAFLENEANKIVKGIERNNAINRIQGYVLYSLCAVLAVLLTVTGISHSLMREEWEDLKKDKPV